MLDSIPATKNQSNIKVETGANASWLGYAHQHIICAHQCAASALETTPLEWLFDYGDQHIICAHQFTATCICKSHNRTRFSPSCPIHWRRYAAIRKRELQEAILNASVKLQYTESDILADAGLRCTELNVKTGIGRLAAGWFIDALAKRLQRRYKKAKYVWAKHYEGKQSELVIHWLIWADDYINAEWWKAACCDLKDEAWLANRDRDVHCQACEHPSAMLAYMLGCNKNHYKHEAPWRDKLMGTLPCRTNIRARVNKDYEWLEGIDSVERC